MGTAGWSVGAIVVIVLLVGVPWWMFRRSSGKQRNKAQVNGFGVSVKTESSSDIAPGIKVNSAVSREGAIVATDQSGRGVEGANLDAKGDILLTNAPPVGDAVPKR